MSSDIDAAWETVLPKIVDASSNLETPAYVYLPDVAASRFWQLRRILPTGSELAYSAKANGNPDMISALCGAGALIDIASAGEIEMTRRAGVPQRNLIFTGPAKSHEELTAFTALEGGIVVLESAAEARRLQSILTERKQVCDVLARIRIDAKLSGVQLSMTAAPQFGFDYRAVLNFLADFAAYPNLNFRGLHGYLGTGIEDPEHALSCCNRLCEVIVDIAAVSGRDIEIVDLGGGFGVPRAPDANEPDWPGIGPALQEAINRLRKELPKLRRIIFESGRYIVGPAGAFLTRVIELKRTSDNVNVVLVDGGAGAFSWDGAQVGFRPGPLRLIAAAGATPLHDRDILEASIYGPLCTPADRIAHRIGIETPASGDFVMCLRAGAYGYGQGTGFFISRGFPTEYVVGADGISLSRKRVEATAGL